MNFDSFLNLIVDNLKFQVVHNLQNTKNHIMVFDRVKQWFGIEGIKIEILVPEEVDKNIGEITGQIYLTSMHAQTLKSVKISLIEKFSRGRSKNRLTDDYELGEITINKEIVVTPDNGVYLDFTLPYELQKSEMDELEDKNFFFKGIAKAAKWTRGVESLYRIEAEGFVKGTALNPFDEKEVRLV